MAVLELLVYPDRRLKQKSASLTVIDDSLRLFITALEETLRAGPGGVGIAAPQVGRFERIVILDVSGKKDIPHHGHLVLINPEIIAQEGSIIGREGCLSVPDYTGNVVRSKNIAIKALDRFGKEQTYRMEGYEARAAQHEIDHLDGLLFLDRLVTRRNSLFRRKIYKQA